MNVFSKILAGLKKLGPLVDKVWGLARAAGVDDELLGFALKWIRVANNKFVDNTERREWVVKILIDRKVPESIARLVVEMAFQLYRREIGKLDKI